MSIVDAKVIDSKDASSGDLASQKDVPSAVNKTEPSREAVIGKPEGDRTEGKPIVFATQGELDAFLNKRHGKLDTSIRSLTDENKEIKEALAEMRKQHSEANILKLEDDEKAELEAAGDDLELRKQVSTKHKAVRHNADLTAENSRLEERISDNKELLQRLSEGGFANVTKSLSEKYDIPERIIATLAKRINFDPTTDTPEELEDLVKNIAEELPLGNTPKLPNTPQLSPSGVGMKKSDKEILDEMYPTMAKR